MMRGAGNATTLHVCPAGHENALHSTAAGAGGGGGASAHVVCGAGKVATLHVCPDGH
eukprot:SAG22_NODE_19892_length_270_cov_1.520468_1_plen_56_part_10